MLSYYHALSVLCLILAHMIWSHSCRQLNINQNAKLIFKINGSWFFIGLHIRIIRWYFWNFMYVCRKRNQVFYWNKWYQNLKNISAVFSIRLWYLFTNGGIWFDWKIKNGYMTLPQFINFVHNSIWKRVRSIEYSISKDVCRVWRVLRYWILIWVGIY